MAFVSVTYTFVNDTAADATAVNTNFSDVIAGLSDGTKDLNIAALTLSGTATFNGSSIFGNSSVDDIQFNGSMATNLVPKTQRTYGIGSADLGLSGIYFGMNSSHTINLIGPSSGASADYTLTLPPVVGVYGQIMVNQGSGTTLWKFPGVVSAKSADYTVTDTDGIEVILMTTSNTDRTVTLPTAADNTDRELVVKKVDSGTGKVILDGEGSETIDGATTLTLFKQYGKVRIKCDGSNWYVIEGPVEYGTYTPTVSASTNVSSSTIQQHFWKRIGSIVSVSGRFDVTATSSANTATSITLTLPLASNFTDSTDCAGSGVGEFKTDEAREVNAQISGDVTNDGIQAQYAARNSGAQAVYYSCQYVIK